MADLNQPTVVGQRSRRHDAREKVTGRATYAADVVLPGMLHAKVLRSPHPHARIKSIDLANARVMAGVRAVLSGSDPAAAAVGDSGYFIKDRPILARGKVRYRGDIVACVAADTEAQAAAALASIAVEYEVLPYCADIGTALAANAPILFEDAPPGIVPHYGAGASGALRSLPNVCFQFNYRTGDELAFDGCDFIYEDTFEFSQMHHFTLEPFVCVARPTDEGGIEIWTSSHTPFVLRKELARTFKQPENAIAIHVPYVGGSFGSKSGCRTEHIAMLLAQVTRRPVRLCFTFEEGFLTSAQHGARLHLRTGVMKDGTLVARQSVIHLDSGAYSDSSPLVAEKAGYRISGPYRYKFIDTQCYCVMTNTVPAGAFRGFGGTQATWASESQIDMIARRLGIDPIKMRKRNMINLGEAFVPGESGTDSDLHLGLDLVASKIGYGNPRQPGRGIGVSIGFKDGGGIAKPAQARVKVSPTGDIFLSCGTIEVGQGARSALTQVVAELLSAPLERVRYLPVNTDVTPFDQGTNASSGISVMGQAIALACNDLKQQVVTFAAQELGWPANEVRLSNWHAERGNERVAIASLITKRFGGTGMEFVGNGFFQMEKSDTAPLEAKTVFWEIGWAAVEVEVDERTGQVKIHNFVVSGDAGKAINPLLCRGQDEGAAVMGLAQALFEQTIYRDGQLINGDPLIYRVPLAEDLPESFISITQEQGHGPGPFGAKGMGEGGMLPIASAIANAIHDAVGVRIQQLPMSPERVLRALEAKKTEADKQRLNARMIIAESIA